MTDPHTLDALCNALGRQGGTVHEALRQVRALREHSVKQHELLEQFMGSHSWDADDAAMVLLVGAARALIDSAIAPAPHPGRRLAVLTQALPKISALLLESIHLTHADVLQLLQLTHSAHQGLEVECGEYLHKPTGRRYLLSVVPMEAHT